MAKEIDIFWATADYDENGPDWNMLYYEPVSLINELNKKNSKETDNFLKCPAVNNYIKNIYVIKNSMTSSYKIKGEQVVPTSKQYINSYIAHPPTLNNNSILKYGLSYIFFTPEDNLKMSLTSPYFSNSQHLKYGNLVPGEFDISSWFRNINFEFNLWGADSFEIFENEDICYIKFNTDKKIKMHRFQMNNELKRISYSTGTSSNWKPLISLQDRYNMFKRSRLKNLVLKEIHSNII
jgi:hypothetical protein